MSQIKARYTGGSPEGVDLSVPIEDGTTLHVHVPHGGELPTEVDGVSVPASYRDGLLSQKDEWSEVRRETTKSATAEKEG